ncbi:hypothetical protein SpCBS45565_g07861 [Spizellomyces sp. 'palustris']|nr:hypothetical protein SpCBS45565_g07861 [Spizellomyces sp. 'palustris']
MSVHKPHSNIIPISDPHAKTHLCQATHVPLPPGTAPVEEDTDTLPACGDDNVLRDPFRDGEDPKEENEAAKKWDGHNWTWVSGNHLHQLPDPKPSDLPVLDKEDTTPDTDPDNIVARSRGGNEQQEWVKAMDQDEIVYVEEPDGTADLTG